MSLRSRTQEGGEALEEAVLKEFPHGVRRQGLKLVSDNGCQPSTRSFLEVASLFSLLQAPYPEYHQVHHRLAARYSNASTRTTVAPGGKSRL